MQFDTIIRGAEVIDGAGRPRRRADVGVRGDVVAAVEDLSAAQGDVVIEGAGKVVCPGFIDIHTHSDTTLFEYPEAESRVRQGITTEVVGNCSYSPFPVTPAVREFMGRCLSQGQAELPWQWNDQQGYHQALRDCGTSVNVAPLVGHGALRLAAMGCDQRPPNASELKQMQRLAAEAIDEGAFGLSTGLTLAPSSYAETAELVEISKAVAGRGGFYATHSRLWADHHFRAVEEALEIGRQANLPVQISHQTIIDPRYFGQADKIVRLMETARAEGIDVTYDVYPYTAGSSLLDQYLPDWALEGGAAGLLSRLADPPTRAAIREETSRGWFRGIPWQWERVMLSHLANPEQAALVGRSIGDVADELGVEPIDCMLDLLATNGNEVSVVQFNRDEPDVQFFLAHPLAMIGSDGVSISPRGPSLETRPHPRYYGTYPRVLGRYCRELRTLSLEDAIRKMTAAPAARMCFKDRGLLAPGKKADLVLFDPATVADRATFDQPHQFPVGIDYVLVNGKVVVSPAGHTGKRPGVVLTRGA